MKIYLHTFGSLFFAIAFLYVKHAKTQARIRRIISGKIAAVGQFPWHVILKKPENDGLLCGGSIISDKWVLTAAHCTFQLESVFLAFGSIELDNNEYNMTSSEIFVHSQYNSTTLLNDISLIKLPTSLEFSSNVQSVTLVSSSDTDDSFLGSIATVVGLGKMNDNDEDYPEILQWGQLEIVNYTQCIETCGDDVFKDTNICVSEYGDTNMEICYGDSGGSMVVSKNGLYLQIGISSFTSEETCALEIHNGFVKITAYLDYILNVMDSK